MASLIARAGRLSPQWNRVRRLVKEGSWIVVGQIGSVIGSLALIRVLTESLEPQQYGELALSLTLGTLVCQVSMSGVMPGIARYYAIAAEKNDLPSYLRASKALIGYGTLVTVVLGSLLMVGTQLLEMGIKWFHVAAAIVFIQVGSYSSTLSSIHNAARDRFLVASHSALDPWVRIAFVFVVIYWAGVSVVAVLTGYILGTSVIVCSQLFFIRSMAMRQAPTGGENYRSWIDQMWMFSKPFTYYQIFTWAQVSSDRWALEIFSNTQDVGIYAVLLQLGYAPITIVLGLMTTLISPILFQRSGDARESARNAEVHRISWKIALSCLLVTFAVFLIALVVHETAFSILVAEKYRSASYLLPWVLLAGGMFAAAQVLSLKLTAEMNTAALVWPKLTTALVGIGLNFAFAKYAGLEGVVIAAVFFSVSHLAWFSVLAVRKTENCFVR